MIGQDRFGAAEVGAYSSYFSPPTVIPVITQSSSVPFAANQIGRLVFGLPYFGEYATSAPPLLASITGQARISRTEVLSFTRTKNLQCNFSVRR